MREGREVSRSGAEFKRPSRPAVHAIPVDIIDALPKVLKTDNAGRSTAPQKGPIRSNLRGSSIGPSVRLDGRTTALAAAWPIEFRDLLPGTAGAIVSEKKR